VSETFGNGYASAYDSLYADKDYGAECDLIEAAAAAHASRPIRSILDFGCGTGSHALPLAARGYNVVGVDRSPGMLEAARAKDGGSAVDWHLGDLRDCPLARRFDLVLMMFAVLGYQHANQDVTAALANARAHLEPGGILLFDVWHGPAVLAQRPSQRVRRIQTARGEILRLSSGRLDTNRHLCTVDFDLMVIEDSRVVSRDRESHPMRYFFPLELELLLQTAGMRLVRLCSFDDSAREPDDTTWNVLAVAVPA
jgi:SAM-dependent methyltransferase